MNSRQAVTSKQTTALSVYNEYGLRMGLREVSYEDTEEGRVWTAQMKIGAPGVRTFQITAKNQAGEMSGFVTTNEVTVSRT